MGLQVDNSLRINVLFTAPNNFHITKYKFFTYKIKLQKKIYKKFSSLYI